MIKNQFIKFEIEKPINKYFINSKKEAVKLTHDLVQKSVLSRSNSDVSLGTFLSGGVDSSIISLCLSQQLNKKIDTFSICFVNSTIVSVVELFV